MDPNETYNEYIEVESRQSSIEEVTEYKVKVDDKYIERTIPQIVADRIVERIADKFIQENYDNILDMIDMNTLAEKVGKLIQNKLSIDILKKELNQDFSNEKKKDYLAE